MNKPLNNTGSWIFEQTATDINEEHHQSAAEAFAKWETDDLPHVLWIKGEPGKGKTMLAISLVGELQGRRNRNVAYFFCVNSDNEKNNAVYIVRAILRQIYHEQPELLPHFYKNELDLCKGIEEKRDPKKIFSTFCEVFQNTINDPKFKRTYFVIDALDECEHASLPRFLELVKKSNQRAKVKWLVTSRDENIINQELQLQGALTISLEDNSRHVNEAVDRYVDDRVKKLATRPEYGNYDGDLQTFIANYLREHANGTFLWVALVCEELKKVPAMRTRNALGGFPSGLTPLYKRILDQVLKIEDKADAHYAQNILQAVLVAFRQLTLFELAVAADLPKESRDNEQDIKYYIGLCRSFLGIQGTGHVSLRHKSVKDYLAPRHCLGSGNCPAAKESFETLYSPIPESECFHRCLGPNNYPSLIHHQKSAAFPINEAKVHHGMVSRSLQAMSTTLRRDVYNLENPGLSIEEVPSRNPDPLVPIRYACVYWIDHLCEIKSGYDEIGLFDNVENFLFGEEKKHFLHWLEALSLMRSMSSAVPAIRKLENLLAVSIPSLI